MLEYEFTELDNDYITLWSRYLTCCDSTVVIADLEKLAELGQINAIQSWYRIKKSGDNKKIDKIVKGYNDATFNHLHAKSNYYYSMDSERLYIENLISDIKSLNVEISKTEGWRQEQMLEEKTSLISNIRQCSYLKNLSRAIDVARDVALDTHNILVYERLAELEGAYGRITPLGVDSRHFLKSEVRNYKKIRKSLYKNVLELAKKKGGKVSPQEDPQLFFALAKNLMFSEKDTKYANEIFAALANREYSAQLQDVISRANAKKDRWNDLREMTEEDMKGAGYSSDVIAKVLNMQQTMNFLDSLEDEFQGQDS